MANGEKSGNIKAGKKEYRIATKEEQVWTFLQEVFPKCDYFHELDGRVNLDIVYVVPEISKKKPVVVKKCSVSEKLYGGADFRFEISQKLWDRLEDEEKKYLILHCCNHMAGGETKTGEHKFRINRHDFGDFNINMEVFGSEVRQQIARKNYDLYQADEKDNETESLKIEI